MSIHDETFDYDKSLSTIKNKKSAWHDFPFKEGLYAIRDEKNTSIVKIIECIGTGKPVWRFRLENTTHLHKFDPKQYAGKCFGPIKLPSLAS